MKALTKLSAITFAVSTVLSGVGASPLALAQRLDANNTVATSIHPPFSNKVEAIRQLLGRDTPFEWTAFGDSYASGAGAGDYIPNSYRCLRYNQAYPILMDAEARLGAGTHVFRDGACSGSKTADVQAYQFDDEDTWWKPGYTFGRYTLRPSV
jgi:hypothetical protein